MKTTNRAADLLNLLACLTIIADAADQADALDSADFWARAATGEKLHLPDGRTLVRL